MIRSKLLPLATLAATALLAAPAWGAELVSSSVTARSATAASSCSERILGAGQGVMTRRATVPESGWVRAELHGVGAGDWDLAVFDRASGLLGEHPILEGRNPSERVNRVITFTGQALGANAGVASLLRLAPSAIERTGRSAAAQVRSVAGLSQAVALEHGKGRVVVLGEAAVATSQVVGPPGNNQRMGLRWPGGDNERFIVNALYWLAGAM